MLFAHAMRNGTFRTIAGSSSHTMSSASLHDGDLTVDSTVFEELGTPFVAGGWIVAGKTGYTPEAGLCLATAARSAAGPTSWSLRGRPATTPRRRRMWMTRGTSTARSPGL